MLLSLLNYASVSKSSINALYIILDVSVSFFGLTVPMAGSSRTEFFQKNFHSFSDFGIAYERFWM
jgi:hypothetical protein